MRENYQQKWTYLEGNETSNTGPFFWDEPSCILTQSYAGMKTAKLKFPNYITLSVLPAPLSYLNLRPEALEQQQDSFKLGPWGTMAIAEGFALLEWLCRSQTVHKSGCEPHMFTPSSTYFQPETRNTLLNSCNVISMIFSGL